MAGFQTDKRTKFYRLCRAIAGGVLGLWIGLAAADEAGPEFRYWIPSDSGNADPKPVPARAVDESEDTESSEGDRTGVRSRLSRSASGLNGGFGNNGNSGGSRGGGGSGGGGRGGGGGGGGRR